jgi:radical SAM superfamily enzyme YgiQ (UPF0313 family)
VRVLLISTYDLGRQPAGLASPAAWLRGAGVDVECVDVSRDKLHDGQIGAADVVAFYLPMHTATRLAAPLVRRVRRVNACARLAAYGLYAPLNAEWLREHGVDHVLGPDAEADLVSLVISQRSPLDSARGGLSDSRGPTPNSQSPTPDGPAEAGHYDSQPPTPKARRLRFVQPDRSTLPPLSRYAALQMPDGSRRVVGATEATRGCKHTCRHCPIVPVYNGTFQAIPIDIVIEDIRAQVAGGAQHISFGDPDFLNGPTHARRLVERLARECPGLTFDATIKIEHILQHADMLPLLRGTGCLMVTSAVESVDDEVLRKLQKGHTRADFVEAVGLCRGEGIALAPTFIPFTPWTTIGGYVDLLDEIDRLDLTRDVAPIQLAIRLLVTSRSRLLELPDITAIVEPFDAASLTFPWRHPDPRVDELHREVMRIVGMNARAPRAEVFARIVALVKGSDPFTMLHRPERAGACNQTPPFLTEAWYCCAEPGPELFDLV